MKLIIFDAYGTLISTGTGSLDAVRKILSLLEKDIDPEQFYKEWKRLHRMNMDYANNNSFIAEESIFKLDLERNKMVVDKIYTSEMIRKYKPEPEFL